MRRTRPGHRPRHRRAVFPAIRSAPSNSQSNAVVTMTRVALMFKRKSVRRGFAQGCFKSCKDESAWPSLFFAASQPWAVFAGGPSRKKHNKPQDCRLARFRSQQRSEKRGSVGDDAKSGHRILPARLECNSRMRGFVRLLGVGGPGSLRAIGFVLETAAEHIRPPLALEVDLVAAVHGLELQSIAADEPVDTTGAEPRFLNHQLTAQKTVGLRAQP